jgi:hypothetical protein
VLDEDEVIRETMWLIDNPAFERRPATIREFLDEPYLGIRAKVRPGLATAFEDIFGSEVSSERISQFESAMFTGAIGIGKTTFASIALPYMAHWVLCLKDPQDFYDLLPGSRIAFMQMSTSATHAKQVIFGDIKARINNSRWFAENFPYDDKFTNQIRFPKDIWIIPGDSGETSFEGYNILAGILDEMDSHKKTEEKDYAEQGYNTIQSRIASRFVDNSDPDREGHKGLLICIGQMKSASGFASKKYKELVKDSKAKVVRMTIWESFGWDKYTKPDGTRNSFWYDIKRKRIIPTGVADLVEKKDHLIEVPRAFLSQFENNPERALRDLAGIPPEAQDVFISLVDRIEECRDRWIERHGDESPVDDNPVRPQFAKWFKANLDPRRRAIHVDLAVSGNGDALGMAMGHIEEIVEREGEKKPYIVFDMLLRIHALPGTEIMLSDVRHLIYYLKDELKFRITGVTYDGFQSTESIQQIRKRRIAADNLSVDKSTLPYEDLREAIYERRLEFPPYVTYLQKGSTERVEIAVQELMRLQFDGKKVDHPVDGSKDVADAMAGVTYQLMGDRNYRKGVTSLSDYRDRKLADTGTDGSAGIEDLMPRLEGYGMQAPVPPLGTGFGITIPRHLRAR